MTDTQKAARFFWAWLVLSTSVSIAANVTHALLSAGGGGSRVIAACVAIVPPVSLLALTHIVQLLVRTRIMGAAYRAALCVTVVLAVVAFVLSYATLRDLAILWGGLSSWAAWLWPLPIDLSIAGSTLALLALNDAQRAAEVPLSDEKPWQGWTDSDTGEAYTLGDLEQMRQRIWQSRGGVAPISDQAVADHGDMSGLRVMVDELAAQAVGMPLDAEVIRGAAVAGADSTSSVSGELREAAERIVEAGATRIDRQRVVDVLHEHENGMRPSMIARKLGVGYSTVVRILDEHRRDVEALNETNEREDAEVLL